MSIVLGGVVVAVGLQFRGSVESAQSTLVGSLLIGTGALLLLLEVTGHGHRHTHSSDGSHTEGHRRALIPFMVSFGAAASPDLTILPVFLAATAAGVGASVGSLVVFGAATVATFVVVTLAATAGGYRLAAYGWRRPGIS